MNVERMYKCPIAEILITCVPGIATPVHQMSDKMTTTPVDASEPYLSTYSWLLFAQFQKVSDHHSFIGYSVR